MEQPFPPESPLEWVECPSGFRLTLLVAPSGSGKTTLLHRWEARLRSEEKLVAWLSLRTDDNTPDRFWSDLLGVINNVYPLDLPAQTDDLDFAMTNLINQLSDIPGRLLLILDDYHNIVNEAIHQAVGMLLDYPPTGLALIIASRSQPPLQIPRLRARRQLLEIGVADLRMDSFH